MKKVMKTLMIVAGVLVIALLIFMAGYVDGVFTGTARGLMIAADKIVPVGHALHRNVIPQALEMLDTNIEEVVIELRHLQSHLGRSDSKLLSSCKSLLQRYHRDHPDAL